MNSLPKALLVLSILGIVTAGCVPTTFKHEISVVRDADGKIIQTIETEGIEQPNAENTTKKIKFKILDVPK